MTSSYLREELNCSICQDIYTDPVTLTCGHNFCLVCIKRTWDHQEERESSCPECRQRFKIRPELKRNLRLCNIVERFLSTQKKYECLSGIFCTYCKCHAAKTCLECAVSLCDQHLGVHSKSVNHKLIEPTRSLENIKCSIHGDLLKYYCLEDGVCICMLCSLARNHRGHQMEPLNIASEKKKQKLRNVIKQMSSGRKESQSKLQSLQESKTDVQEKSASEQGNVRALFRDIRERLEALENQALDGISILEKQATQQISELMQSLEMKNDELLGKILHTEELCNMNDPITVLRGWDVDNDDYSNAEEYNVPKVRNAEKVPSVGDLDKVLTAVTLKRGLADIITGMKAKRGFNVPETVDFLMDIDKAGRHVLLSEDLKTATYSLISQNQPQRLEQLEPYQVSSSRSFSSGQHYWEVEVSKLGDCRVGLACSTTDRETLQSTLGHDKKSWCLRIFGKNYSVIHYSKEHFLHTEIFSRELGIYLDIEAGRLSFYQLGDQFISLFPGMADVDMRKELTCSACQEIYTDPISLICGHSFCMVCITRTWDYQDDRDYTCPECRYRFRIKPELRRNMRLNNIAEHFRAVYLVDEEEDEIICDFCEYPASAVRSCLLCEVSICEKHLAKHNKSAQHILTEPTTSFEDRKCPDHMRLLEFYCTNDNACICVECSVAGNHRGHQAEPVNEASKKKKDEIRNVMEILTSQRQQIEKIVQSLEYHRTEAQRQSADEFERVTALFEEINIQLELLKNKVLDEITKHEEQVLLYISEQIQQLEINKYDLTRKMLHIEKLYNMNDPLTVLREWEPDSIGLCDAMDDYTFIEQDYKKVPVISDTDRVLMSLILQKGLDDIVANVKTKKGFSIHRVSDLLLDVNTAGKYVALSADFKTASWMVKKQRRTKTPDRFVDYHQVLSSRQFSSGQHYWEVKTSESGDWRVGMTYPSIERKGYASCIGNNKKSWCLERTNNKCSAVHNSEVTLLQLNPYFPRLGIYLDYEAGRLSFYQLCDPCPALRRDLKLRSPMERSHSTQEQEGAEIFCTYCVKSSVPATKTCLYCEASMCDDHIKIHSKSVEHVLIEPTTSLEDRKCSIHKKLIEFYCSKDGACICVSCCIIGEHRGHKMEPLKDAFEKNKGKLKGILDNLKSNRDDNEKKVEKLRKKKEEVEDKVAGVTERVTSLFRDIKEQLEDLQKRTLSEISKQEEKVTSRVSSLIQELQKKNDELSKKIRDIEELSNVTDPLTVLKKGFNEEVKKKSFRKSSDGDWDINVSGSLNEAPISMMLHMGLLSLADILLDLKAKRQFPALKASDLTLDVKTAHNKIIVSSDFKSASYSATSQKYPDGAERFKSCQVLSTSCFSSGQHYWEVDVSEAKRWIVGVAYPSIERKIAGNESFIGYNDKSWCLFFQKYLGASHNNIQQNVTADSAIQSIGIFLDYDGGRVSFFQLSSPVKHLHTFTATFTEPLHAAFYIFENSSIRIKS
ncbi:uncharacterized protein WCC33_014206 [Rhinophrynus dorsalis]